MKLKIYGHELEVPEECPNFSRSPVASRMEWMFLFGTKEAALLYAPDKINPMSLSAILSTGAMWWLQKSIDDMNPEDLSEFDYASAQFDSWHNAAAEAFRRAKGGE